jgi:FMN phosphatase YigB (HAD superfamily)
MIKVILFDLDGTLYTSTEIREQFAQASYHTLAKFRNITLEEGQRLVIQRREELIKKHGSSIPYTLTLKSLAIPIEYWHKQNIAFFDPRNYLKEDKQLTKSLIQLKEHYQLAIITNNNTTQT